MTKDRQAPVWMIVLLAALIVASGYGAAYWWRLPYAQVEGGKGNPLLLFPNTFETAIFEPASWVHWKLHPPSIYERADHGFVASLITREELRKHMEEQGAFMGVIPW